MDQFIKVYRWMAKTGLSPEEILVYALINSFTEQGIGYFAGYDGIQERTGVKSRKARAIVQKLVQIGAVEQSKQFVYGQTKNVLRSVLNFAQIFTNDV